MSLLWDLVSSRSSPSLTGRPPPAGSMNTKRVSFPDFNRNTAFHHAKRCLRLALAIARVKSENVAATEVLDTIDMKKILKGILNPSVLAIGFMFMLDNITVQGEANVPFI